MPEIDDWVDGLSGRSHKGQEDAELLRRTLLRSEEKSPEREYREPEEDLRYLALLRRLRDEGLINEEKAAVPVAEKGIWPFILSGAFALILLAAVGVAFLFTATEELFPHYSENFDQAPRYRGMTGAAEDNTVDSAEAMADLIGQLSQHGFPYRLKKDETRWTLMFYAADDLSADASQWLERTSYQVTPAGWFFIVLDEKGQ